MADTLSLEAQLASRLETEAVKLRAAATSTCHQQVLTPTISSPYNPRSLPGWTGAGSAWFGWMQTCAYWPKRGVGSAPACRPSPPGSRYYAAFDSAHWRRAWPVNGAAHCTL